MSEPITPISNAGYSGRLLRRNRFWLIGLWLAMSVWPLAVANDYIISLGIAFFINLVLVSSLNLTMGYTGLISLCHAAFFGLGAYISGVLNVHYGVTPALGLIAGTVGTAMVASLIAIPTLRLRGHYLAMGTLGFNAIMGVLFVELVSLTGGPNGLVGVEPFSLGSVWFDTPRTFFYFAWVSCFVLMFLMLNLVSGSIGRNMRAVSGSEVAADTLGINTVRLKILIFSISAGIAGFAGVLYVHFNMFASPETFGVFPSVLLLVMVALGGAGTYWGPFVGALLFTAVPELLRSFHDIELLIFGLCMIVVLLYFPGGIVKAFAFKGHRTKAPAEGESLGKP